jgi:phage tail-like protein
MRSDEIARLLPDVFQHALSPPAAGVVKPDRRLAALLEAMEVLHDPCERILDELNTYFDPRLAPPRFVPYLAGWVDLDWLLLTDRDESRPGGTPLASGVDRLREIVAAATWVARWRGTAQGLRRFLDAVTGVPGFVIDENVAGPERRPSPFNIRVLAPQAAEAYRPLVERVIMAEKPAYVTHELEFVTAAVAPLERG